MKLRQRSSSGSNVKKHCKLFTVMHAYDADIATRSDKKKLKYLSTCYATPPQVGHRVTAV